MAPRSRRSPRRRSILRRLLGETAGAVFAEAVIMMPFFIIVLGCIIYSHAYYSQRIALSAHVKSCAWQYADSGCQQLQGDCAGFVTAHAGNELGAADLPDGSALDALRSLRFVGPILNIVLGQNSIVDRHETVTRPAVLGGGARDVYSIHSVMCNEVPKTPGQIVHDAFCAATGGHICH
jgi:hypothetical protein